jgi:hypothetical protein
MDKTILIIDGNKKTVFVLFSYTLSPKPYALCHLR